MDLPAQPLNRRWALAALLGLAAGGPVSAQGRAGPQAAEVKDHFPFGPLARPRTMPAWPLTTHEAQATDLPRLLRGRITALQLMFTGCSATCPIQGALFAQAQRLLGARLPQAQFVSLSIDALGDTPAHLRRWLTRVEAQPGWVAAVPQPGDVDAIVQRLGDGGERRPTEPDPHSGQVYLFDRGAALAFRTPSMPPPQVIVDTLFALASRS